MIIDFSNCKESGILYSGSESKVGILYHDEAYMLKFRKLVHGSSSYSHVYLQKHFWKEHTFWTDGYFACSVGSVSEEMLRRYIENQG